MDTRWANGMLKKHAPSTREDHGMFAEAVNLSWEWWSACWMIPQSRFVSKDKIWILRKTRQCSTMISAESVNSLNWRRLPRYVCVCIAATEWYPRPRGAEGLCGIMVSGRGSRRVSVYGNCIWQLHPPPARGSYEFEWHLWRSSFVREIKTK